MPAAVAFVAFPRFVEARERGEDAFHWLRTSLARRRRARAARASPCSSRCASFVGRARLRRPLRAGCRPCAAPLPGDGGARARRRADVLPHRDGVACLRDLRSRLGRRDRRWSRSSTRARSRSRRSSPSSASRSRVAQFAAARSLCRWRPPLQRLAAPWAPAMLLDSEPRVELSVVLPVPQRRRCGLRRMLEEPRPRARARRFVRDHRRLGRKHRRDRRDRRGVRGP